MAADLKEIKSKDAATKQILDYYKRYSVNKELPKFFSGVTYISNIGDDNYEPNTRPSTNVNITVNESKEQRNEHSLDISRASSTMSNRKLEWDNGADIGYSNCQDVKVLHRSSSLPVFLNRNGNKFDSHKKRSNIKSSKSYSTTDENVKLVIFTCSSSSETQSPVTDCSSSSFPGKNISQEFSSGNSCNLKNSTSQNSDSSSNKKISNFSSTLSYLKQKIGLPGAHSTPYVTEELETKPTELDTFVVQNSEMPVRIPDLNIYNKSRSNENLLKMESTVEQKEVKTHSKSKNKVVTLCLTKPLTVECKCIPKQTESKVHQTKTKQSTIGIQTEDISEKELIKIITKTRQNMNQSLICYEHLETDASNIGSIQTNSGPFLSNCDSFQYIINVDPFTDEKSGDFKGYELIKSNRGTKLDQTVNNLYESERRIDFPNNPTRCSPNPLFTKNVSSIENKSTIIPDKYKSANSSQVSSNSSLGEILFSNQTNNIGPELKKNIHLLQKLVKSKKYDNATKKQYIKRIIKNISDSNLLEASNKTSEVVSPKESKLISEQTITSDLSTVNDALDSPKVDKNQTSDETGPDNEYSPSSKLYQNWKDDKTLSEKLFEQKHFSGEGDYLVNWADKERQYQISWINNEIKHLGQLKNFLEKTIAVGAYPRKSRKTTSVYKISRISSELPRENPQKYVIQTRLDVKSPEQVEYNLHSEKFVVENLLGDLKNRRKSRQVLGDIKIVSNDNTININVTTFCDTCKRSPCICQTDYLENLNNPTLSQKYNPSKENECYRSNNIFPKDSVCSYFSDQNTISLKTICLECQKLVCICDKNSIYKHECATESRIEDYSECFLPTFLPSSKSEGTGLSSSSSNSKTSLKIDNPCCSACRKCPCLCEQQIENNIFLQNVEDLQENSNNVRHGALQKVFENCVCNAEGSCDCQFVDNLLEHFNIKKNGTNEYVKEKESAYKCIYSHVAIQTEIDTKNRDVQTYNNKEHKLSQTDEEKLQCDYGHFGLQIQVGMRNQNPKSKQIDNKYTQTSTTLKHKQQTVSKEMLSKYTERSNSLNEEKHKMNKDALNTQNSPNLRDEVIHKANISNEKDTPYTIHENERTLRGAVHREYSCIDKATQYFLNNNSTNKQTINTINNKATCLNNDAVNKSQQRECPKCTCTMMQTDTFTENKRNCSICTNTDKRIKFETDSYIEKTRKNKASYGNRLVNKVSADSSRATMYHKNMENDTNSCKSQTIVQMSTVGTCTCGFNDKSYNRDECNQIMKSNCDSAGDVTNNRIYSKTSSTASFAVDEISISTNTGYDLRNTCVCCDNEYSIENIAILSYRNQQCPYCLECLQKYPILISACNNGLEQIPAFLRSESKSESVQMADETAKEVVEKYCTCTRPSCSKNTDYCTYCQFKLGKTIKNNNGIAYSLTLECDSPVKYKCKKRKKKQIEEIILKVPCPYSKKKHKDEDNLTKKDANKARINQRNNDVQTDRVENNEKQKQKTKMGVSLQEYLKINRPDFINKAEYRRKTVEKYKLDREFTKDQIKLRCLEDNIHKNPTRRHKLFTEKEMREITKKNYEKLPEITNKHNHYRQQRLRDADKYIVNTFAKKIQFSVLKGKRSFPIDKNIISMQI